MQGGTAPSVAAPAVTMTPVTVAPAPSAALAVPATGATAHATVPSASATVPESPATVTGTAGATPAAVQHHESMAGAPASAPADSLSRHEETREVSPEQQLIERYEAMAARERALRAHPRSRGENPASTLGVSMGAGSSPLTRGKLHIRSLAGAMARLIPAHAGKTSSCQRRSLSGRAHPRSRRENRTVTLYARGDLGSSPLTRGKRAVICAASCSRGLIPAHAGKTKSLSHSSDLERAHPRSRGENRDHAGRGPVLVGSSPLTRGKRPYARCDRPYSGLIPAHAWKTE